MAEAFAVGGCVVPMVSCEALRRIVIKGGPAPAGIQGDPPAVTNLATRASTFSRRAGASAGSGEVRDGDFSNPG